MCAPSDTAAVWSLTVSLFLVCCGLASSWPDSAVSSAFTWQTTQRLHLPFQVLACGLLWSKTYCRYVLPCLTQSALSVVELLLSNGNALKDAMWCMQRFGTVWSQCEWNSRVTAEITSPGQGKLQKSVMTSSKITRIMWKPPFNKAHLKVLTTACCATGYSPWATLL